MAGKSVTANEPTPNTMPVFASLPFRHRVFVQQYVIDWNGTRAAIKAGYSSKRSRVQAAELVAKRNIQRAIEELTSPALQKAQLTVARTSKEISNIAFFDPRVLFDARDRLIPISKLPPEARVAIASFERHEERRPGDGLSKGSRVVKTKFRFHSKIKALQMAGRALRMFTDKVAVSGTLTLEQAILAARRRRGEGR
jgi:phage terminase small subunit